MLSLQFNHTSFLESPVDLALLQEAGGTAFSQASSGGALTHSISCLLYFIPGSALWVVGEEES